MPSLRAAIDAKCKSCIYDPASGNGGWREQVSACSSSNCPLHPVRPKSGGKTRLAGPINGCSTSNTIQPLETGKLSRKAVDFRQRRGVSGRG